MDYTDFGEKISTTELFFFLFHHDVITIQRSSKKKKKSWSSACYYSLQATSHVSGWNIRDSISLNMDHIYPNARGFSCWNWAKRKKVHSWYPWWDWLMMVFGSMTCVVSQCVNFSAVYRSHNHKRINYRPFTCGKWYYLLSTKYVRVCVCMGYKQCSLSKSHVITKGIIWSSCRHRGYAFVLLKECHDNL